MILSCNQHKPSENGGKPIIQFEQTEYDFGNLLMGEKVSHRFGFKNTGNGSLLIKEVVTDCGCTIVKYEKSAIAPNNVSFIELEFDSSGLPGFQIKTISVYSNTAESPVLLTISAAVDYELEQTN